MHRLTLLILPAVAALVATTAPLRAADWPSRPVTVVVPFAAGGNTDMMARLGAQQLSAKFGQTFVVENRPSAGGALGTGVVAAAAPDGYTLLFAASSMITLTPQLQKLSFNPEQQLVPITNVGTGTQMIAIKRELPVKTLPELIAYAKANPGKLNFTVAGTQNISHLAPVLLFARAGIRSGHGPVQGRTAGGFRSHVRPSRPLFRQLIRVVAAHRQRPHQTDRRRHGSAAGNRARHPVGVRDPARLRVLLLERLPRSDRDAGADHRRDQERDHRIGQVT